MQPGSRRLRPRAMNIVPACRFPVVLTVAGCALIALSGCGTQHAGQSASARTSQNTPADPRQSAPADPRQRAIQDATEIIADFPPPPGAARSVRSVSPLLSAPAMSPSATPDVVTATQWWTVPGQPEAVLAWVAAHVPAGFTLGAHGSQGYDQGVQAQPGADAVDRPYEWFDQFSLPPVPNVLFQRSLLVEVVGHGTGQTAIRVDAQVTWLPAKPAAERIPPDAKVLTVAAQPGPGPQQARKRLVDPPVMITDPATVARIAALVDGLPLFPPGVFSCPADFGGGTRLTFSASRNGPALAVVTVRDSGCAGVSLVVGGRSLPALSGGRDLQRQVLAIAGIRWPANP